MMSTPESVSPIFEWRNISKMDNLKNCFTKKCVFEQKFLVKSVKKIVSPEDEPSRGL